jgi:hypothetical protein
MPAERQPERASEKRRALLATLILLQVVFISVFASAQSPPEIPPARAATAPSDGGVTGPRHLRVDRAAGYVELDALVVLRDAPWLELLACTPGSREHESILTVAAKPSEIHLALLILGLEPGSPMGRVTRPATATGPATETVIPPHGALVRVSLVYESNGKSVEVPPSAWVRDRRKNAQPIDDVWVFAGSSMAALDDGTSVYRADHNGNVLTLVSFGDEVLARPGTVTNQNDEEAFGCVPDAIPPVGSSVKIRLRPLQNRPATRPATAPAGSAAPAR